MIIGIGTDIVNCERIARSYERFGERFLSHILTPKERAQMPKCANIAQWLSARFAVKEAAVKALGTGFSEGISCLSVEVLREEGKAPILTLLDKAKEKADELGVLHCHVSYSHEEDFATAFVILEN